MNAGDQPMPRIEAVLAPPIPSSGPTYWLTRFVLLRLLGFVYLIAFLVAANQILPLIGHNGLLPAD
ncbi:MAG: lipase maturation factor family protein, partial [Verrucomicrobiota bacterium]